MGIVDWFSNDFNTAERTLTRDMLSVAIADKEFSKVEKNELLNICQKEGISTVELIDSIRDKKAGAKLLLTVDEKKKYLLHLIRIVGADGIYRSLELKTIEVIAKNIEVSPMLLLSFILDDIKDRNISEREGIDLLNHFVKHFISIDV